MQFVVTVLRLFIYDEEVWWGSIPPHVVRHDPVNKNVPQRILGHLEVVRGNGDLAVQLADSLHARLPEAYRVNLLGDRGEPLWKTLRHPVQHLSSEISAD